MYVFKTTCTGLQCIVFSIKESGFPHLHCSYFSVYLESVHIILYTQALSQRLVRINSQTESEARSSKKSRFPCACDRS